jgi:hypothetical protein
MPVAQSTTACNEQQVAEKMSIHMSNIDNTQGQLFLTVKSQKRLESANSIYKRKKQCCLKVVKRLHAINQLGKLMWRLK